MADISFNCPECGKNLVIAETGAGRSVDCPGCGKGITVPEASNMSVHGEAVSASDSKYKKCTFCAEDILAEAKKCRHCGSMLDGSQQQDVAVRELDPFAQYHTAIKGKKEGKLTLIGRLGLGFGIFIMCLSFAGCFVAEPGDEEGIFYMFMMGLFFAIASYLWARKK